MFGTIFCRLIRYLKFYKLDLTIVMLALIAVSASLLVLGSSFKHLVDSGLKQNYLHLVDKSILFIVILIVIFSIGSFFRSYFINNVTEKIVNQIKQEAYSKIISLPLPAFEELKLGDIISRLTIDIELLSKLIINLLSFFIRNSFMLIGGIILMFWQSPKLGFIVITTIPLLLFPLIRFGKYVKFLSKKALDLQANITANLEESITNIAAIQAFNQQLNKVSNFNEQISNYLKHSSNRLKIRSIFFALTIFIILCSITTVIWLGSRDILHGKLTSGEMVSFIYYAIIAGVSSGGIFELLSEIPSSIVASERVFAIIDYDCSILVERGEKKSITSTMLKTNSICEARTFGLQQLLPVFFPFSTTAKNQEDNNNNSLAFIEFKNVSFSYPSRLGSIIFNNLSFQIGKGQFIGIAGRSGAGKSTIMQLLLKFYSLSEGEIKIMGQDISKIDTQQIRRLIGYIPQDPSIFSGTIRSNIAFVKPDATEQELINAADVTGIMDFAKNLTAGLDTEIGERGVRLSGGQKQKIAISRAILYNPEILLLDEAMSALDSENEQKLLKKLREVMKDKTILSIAHRISSIEQANEILVIDHGQVIARDTHKNLVKNCKIYQIFCKEQVLGEARDF